MDSSQRDAHLAELREHGYTVVRNAIEPDLVDAITAAVARLEGEIGASVPRDTFLGYRTMRIFNLLEYGYPFDQMPTYPTILPLIEGLIGEDCLLSSLSSIGIDPGEGAQPIHTDDMIIPVTKPHGPITCNAIWALTDFTEANGATRIVPKSHTKEDPIFGGEYETIPAEMAKGSALVFDGSLYHGGGANISDGRRLGMAVNYCAGFLRQEENLLLGTPPHLVRDFPPRLQELIGYNVYRGGIGMIHRMSPIDALGAGVGAFKSLGRADPS